MKKYIVTTTIQSPTKATIKYSEMSDWQLVVVGDKKTPENEYRDIDCIFLTPENQEDLNKNLSDSIGWNCIQRRNMGFLFSYQQGADIVATVDDDNIPYEFWGKNIYIDNEVEVDLFDSENGYFDPLSVTNNSKIWHRGYPIEMVPTKNNVKPIGKDNRHVLFRQIYGRRPGC